MPQNVDACFTAVSAVQPPGGTILPVNIGWHLQYVNK